MENGLLSSGCVLELTFTLTKFPGFAVAATEGQLRVIILTSLLMRRVWTMVALTSSNEFVPGITGLIKKVIVRN